MVQARHAVDQGTALGIPAEAASLSGYADALRQSLRTIDPSEFDRWHDAYEAGLQEAYRRKDLDGLVSIAMFGAACLDAQGYHEQTLDQLDFAMSMSRRDPDVAGYLLAL